MAPILYDIARPKIEAGDIILVRGRRGLLAWLTRLFTWSPYTHAGFAFWMDGGLWMAEINGGHNHAVPLSQFDAVDFDVFHRPASATGDPRDAVNRALRTRIYYGYPSLFVIGLLEFLHIYIFVHWRMVMSCAGYVVMILEFMGMPETTRILSPGRLSKMLTFKLAVRSEKN